MNFSSFIQDLKGVLTGHADVMQRVVKNGSYFPVAVLIIALTAGARFVQSWYASEQVRELMGFGLELTFLIKQAVFGFFMTFVVLFFFHLAAVKWFKGKEVDVKGFITVYGFVSAPLLLVGLPVPLAGLVGGVWMLVLFFKMSKAVFGFGFGKTLLVALTGGVVGAMISAFLGSFIGLGSYGGGADFQFDFPDSK